MTDDSSERITILKHYIRSAEILLSVLIIYSTQFDHKGTNIDLPDKLSLVTDDSSDVISPTMLSITELKYLAFTLVIFLLAFKLKSDLFLAKPCIMAVSVVEFSREGYSISMVFG